MSIIPAQPGWSVVESVMDDDFNHMCFVESPIIAWSVKNDGARVVPILAYGTTDLRDFFIKDPVGLYWRDDGSYEFVDATKMARAWAAERFRRFVQNRKHTVETAQAVDNAGEPGGI